ncbi:MAG: hypothetical protein JO166_22280 [Deltaproteobacteria bacterium]|nr:hypothetical protein [Deltaproteobacteria bacterium]
MRIGCDSESKHLDGLLKEVRRAAAAYFEDTESECNAAWMRAASGRLKAAIEQTPPDVRRTWREDWRDFHVWSMFTLKCRAGRESDSDWWYRRENMDDCCAVDYAAHRARM